MLDHLINVISTEKCPSVAWLQIIKETVHIKITEIPHSNNSIKLILNFNFIV